LGRSWERCGCSCGFNAKTTCSGGIGGGGAAAAGLKLGDLCHVTFLCNIPSDLCLVTIPPALSALDCCTRRGLQVCARPLKQRKSGTKTEFLYISVYHCMWPQKATHCHTAATQPPHPLLTPRINAGSTNFQYIFLSLSAVVCVAFRRRRRRSSSSSGASQACMH